MPVVPVYETGRVQAAPITDKKHQAFVADNPIGGALQDLGQGLGRVAQEMERRADQLAEINVKQLDVELGAFESGLLYTPETGALNQRGVNAEAAAAAARKQFEDKSREVLAKARTQQERDMLQGVVDQRRNSVNGTLDRHASRELTVAQDETSMARAQTFGQDAINLYADPAAQAARLSAGMQEIAATGRRQGKDPEVIRLQVEEFVSEAHSGVVRRLLVENPTAAKTYFDANKGKMTPKERDAMAPSVQKHATMAEGLNKAQSIWIASGGDYAAALAAAEKIRDPEERRVAFADLDQRQAREERIEGDMAEDAMQRATAHLIGGGKVDTLPAALQVAIGATGLSQLRTLEKATAEGNLEPKMGPTMSALLAMSVDEPDKFKRLTAGELAELRIDPEDRKALLTKRDSMVNGTAKADPKDEYYKLGVSRAKTLLGAYGLNLDPAQARSRDAQLGAFVIGQITLREAAGEKVDAKMVDEIVKLALVPAMNGTPGRALFFENAPGRVATPSPDALAAASPSLYEGLRKAFTAHNAGKKFTNADMANAAARYEATGFQSLFPYGNIPKAAREQIETKYRERYGRPASNATVENEYTKWLLEH